MTNEELKEIKNAIDAFHQSVYNSKIPASYEIKKLLEYLTSQYLLFQKLYNYEQTVLTYTEMQNSLIIKK